MSSSQFGGDHGLTAPKHKGRERLQELDQIKTAEHGNVSPTDGAPLKASTRCASTLDKNAAVQVKTTMITSNFPNMSPRSSESSDNFDFCLPTFSEPIFPWSTSPEKCDQGSTGIDDLLASLSSNEKALPTTTEGDALMVDNSVGSTQLWTASVSETTDFGFDLFGPVSPSASPKQEAELKFTELMLKIREVGFVDMESMIFEYYSLQFRRDSLPYWLQRRSRQQNLCRLLEQLYVHSGSWPTEDCAPFQQGIKKLAHRIVDTEQPPSSATLLTSSSTNDGLLAFPFSTGNGLL
ncbi:hypothetical protein LTR86_010107 [Recurvomyces mirabilis]|nr:hypothetical protein LTR86_010107 [Recurvomyces mirabilis]